jgi:predicted nucleic acid-binding protein
VTLLVIDASVAAKWCLPKEDEPLFEEALGILQESRSGEVLLAVPEFFWAEIANVLWKAVRLKRCTEADARCALEALRDYELSTISSTGLLDLAFQLALSYNRTVYDCLYVALAVESKAQLITADERLANALAAYLPVKWLGAL